MLQIGETIKHYKTILFKVRTCYDNWHQCCMPRPRPRSRKLRPRPRPRIRLFMPRSVLALALEANASISRCTSIVYLSDRALYCLYNNDVYWPHGRIAVTIIVMGYQPYFFEIYFFRIVLLNVHLYGNQTKPNVVQVHRSE